MSSKALYFSIRYNVWIHRLRQDSLSLTNYGEYAGGNEKLDMVFWVLFKFIG